MITHENIFPYNVVCPNCNAAITAHCLKPKLDGTIFLEQPHIERVIKADEERKFLETNLHIRYGD